MLLCIHLLDFFLVMRSVETFVSCFKLDLTKNKTTMSNKNLNKSEDKTFVNSVHEIKITSILD